MGAVSLQEDSIERFVESNPGTNVTSTPGTAESPVPRPKLRYCPLCVQGFLEESSLDLHVASEHGKQHIYLKVNDRIVRDFCWVNRSLDKCDLVLIGIPAINVEIEFNGKSINLPIAASAPSLMGHLPAGSADDVIRVKVHGTHQTRSFEIYLGRQPTFQPEALDTALLSLMDRMKHDPKTDLPAFREKITTRRLSAYPNNPVKL